MTDDNKQDVVNRRRRQWALAFVVIITIGLGWRYPLIAFSVPAVMVAGMIGGLIRGRYVCGNLCPRGSFFDRMIAPISRGRPIPDWLRRMPLRWPIFVALMAFMVLRISRNPGDINHWGFVFWQMCLITTGIGLVLGVLVHPRAWCSFCPMGTMQNAFGGGKHQLQIDADACRECGLCERACPFGLAIIEHKDKGILEDRDCLKCPECVAVCPVGALAWPARE